MFENHHLESKSLNLKEYHRGMPEIPEKYFATKKDPIRESILCYKNQG